MYLKVSDVTCLFEIILTFYMGNVSTVLMGSLLLSTLKIQ